VTEQVKDFEVTNYNRFRTHKRAHNVSNDPMKTLTINKNCKQIKQLMFIIIYKQEKHLQVSLFGIHFHNRGIPNFMRALT